VTVGLILDRRLRRGQAAQLFLVSILGFVAAGLTPVGPQLLRTPFAVGDISAFITEWAPPSIRDVAPAITFAVFAIVVLMGMVLFLIPIFAGMYNDLGGKLPALTRVMVTLSNVVKGDWFIVFPGIIGVIWGIRYLKRTPQGTANWDRAKLHIPMGIGEIIRKLAVARFSRTLGTLITSGVPILQALEITGQASGNTVIENAMTSVQTSVKEGQSITAPLEKASVFPAMVTQMIAVGEETGSLDAMLGKIADFYEDEVNASVKALTSILEPIMMVGVGAIVGLVVISMYLPIFNMMNIVK